MEAIDFGRSFATWLTHDQSYGRWMLNARLSLVAPNGELVETYYLTNGVMAGRVYAESDLVVDPAMDFRAIFSAAEYKIFRTHAPFEIGRDESGLVRDKFKEMAFSIQRRPADIVRHVEVVIDNALRNVPMNGVIELGGHDDEYTTQMEFPIRHVNANTSRRMFQVETGPVLLRTEDRPGHWDIDDLDIAFTFFNRFEEAYFVKWAPTPVSDKATATVRSYSDTLRSGGRISILVPR